MLRIQDLPHRASSHPVGGGGVCTRHRSVFFLYFSPFPTLKMPDHLGADMRKTHDEKGDDEPIKGEAGVVENRDDGNTCSVLPFRRLYVRCCVVILVYYFPWCFYCSLKSVCWFTEIFIKVTSGKFVRCDSTYVAVIVFFFYYRYFYLYYYYHHCSLKSTYWFREIFSLR